MTLTIEYGLQRYIRDVAEILEKLYIYEGYDNYYKMPTIDEIRSWYSPTNSKYDPLETAVLKTSKGKVIGYAEARTPDDYKPGYTRVIVDPSLPEPLYTEALTILLRWSGRTLAYYDRSVNPITVYAGREHSRIHSAIESIMGGSLIPQDSAYLMEYKGVIANPIPPGLEEQLIIENPSEYAVRELVEVVNDAFSIYPDHHRWKFEEAWNYYNRQFNLDKGTFFIIILRNKDTGEIAGMTEILHYTTGSGRRVGYVSLLAVKRDYQRKGLGRYLLSRASIILKKININTLLLDSVPEARRMYEKLGFSYILKWVKARVPLEAILSI